MSHSSPLGRWTRHGILNFSWNSFESFEKLVLSPSLRDRLTRRIQIFLTGQQAFHSLRLPWRYGIFFFGPSGCGKTAAGRAIARALEWNHLTIPAHEILDSHLFERALADAVTVSHRVIVLEDVDLIIRRMEPEVFFTLLDHAMERAEGTFWIANTRHPEEAPKTQLLRPGRFDEAIRLEPPPAELRSALFSQLVALPAESESADPSEISSVADWVHQTDGLTYSHFEEIRQIVARLKLEQQERGDVFNGIKNYIDDQMIAADRWGGFSDSTRELQERTQQVDARLLTAALDMTDIFRTLIEKVLGDAAEQAKTSQSSQSE